MDRAGRRGTTDQHVLVRWRCIEIGAQIHLGPRVTTLTEGQLADEIRFVAAVAAAKATAVVHAGVVDMMVEQGVDPKEARNFVATNMPFATPQQASDAELALIARHSSEEH